MPLTGEVNALTAPAGDQRQLIAVVYADMTGYSRLIGLDDAGTFSRLRDLRRDLIDPALARHNGTLVNTAGDSLLMTFPSIISAVRFAIDVQRGVPEFDGAHAPDRHIRFRMGVNVGDVIADGTNLHGEGVNIAARLQSVCPPGGICVSRVVRDHVGNRIGVPFKELGALDLKNIARPVEAFVLDLSSGIELAPIRVQSRRSRGAVGLAGAVVGAAIAFGALSMAAIQLRPPSATTPPATTDAAVSASAVPPLSIAVLPFANLSGDPEQAYLADGIVEDLTTDLSHLDGAFVIARESAFSYRGKTIDIRDIGRQLGVRYLLEGSVRKIGNSVRINAQLIAAETGAHLWAERFDKPIAELGAGQDDIVARIGAALDVRLVNLESARRGRQQSGNPVAFDLVLRARSTLLEPSSFDRDVVALGLFIQALRADPNSVPAMAGVAGMFASPHFNNTLKRSADLIAKAATAAPDSPDVLVASFLLTQRQQRLAEATALFRHLMDVDASATGAIVQLGIPPCWTPAPDCIDLFQKTIQLNPRSTALDSLRTMLARSLLLADRNDDARVVLRRLLAAPAPAPAVPTNEDPDEGWRNRARMLLAIAEVRAGNVDEAQAVVRAAMALPSMREYTLRSFVRGVREYGAADEVAQQRRLADDLRRAGLRDHLDEDADSGVAPRATLQEFARLNELTPMSVPNGRMIRTNELVEMRAKGAPLILTTATNAPTVPGSILVDMPGSGSLQDVWQANLKRLMDELIKGDAHRPIVVFGFSMYNYTSRNLALRLLALGYTDVNWYRGGWEAWEASGQRRGPIAGRRNL